MSEGGPGGKSVGKISIKVVPDLEGFRTKLKEELDALEKRVVTIRIDADSDLFREKVDAATRGLKDAKVKVKTEFDRKGDLIHDLDAAMEDAGKRAKLDVTPNIQQSSFQKALRDVKTQAKLANVKLDVDFKDKEAEGRLQALISRLKAIAKVEDIKVKVKTERDHLSSLFGAGSEGAGSAGGNGASIGLRLLTDQTALIAVAIVSFLAPALSLLSTALVSLPALVTAVALPIGVLAFGMGGIKKALDDSGILTETQAFDKHGKPKGKPKQSLGQLIKSIQEPINDVFEKGFTPLFRQLLDAVSGAVPVLQRGLPFIAQGIVNFATGIVRAVTSIPNLQLMDRLTNSVGTMLTNLAPGITSFTNGMLHLITNVGDHLPGLGNVMSGWADRFTGWVDKISKPKQDWFEKDIPNSSTLDTAVTNLKPTLNAIVDFVGKIVDAGLALSTPKMAADIKTTVDALGSFIKNSLPDLVSGFAGIAKAAKELGLISGTDNKDQPKNPDGSSKPTAHPQPGHARTDSPWSLDPILNDLKARLKDRVEGIPGFKSASEFWSRNFDPKLLFANQPLRPGVAPESIGRQPAAPKPPPAPQASLAPLFPGVPGGKDLAGQVNQATSQVKPAIAAMAEGSDKVWDKLVEATKAAGSAIVSQVQAWVGQIQGALAGLGPAGEAAGQALSTGMAAGIAAGASSAIAAAHALAMGVTAAAHATLEINSPSKVFERIGLGVGEGFQNGLEDSHQGVADSAKSLAKKAHGAFMAGNVQPGPGMEEPSRQPAWWSKGFDDLPYLPWWMGAMGPSLTEKPWRQRGQGGGDNKPEPWDQLPNRPPIGENGWDKHGSQVSQGFAGGIASGAASVAKAAQGIAGSATGALTTSLGISSPSKVFHGFGQNTAQGFQDGLEGGFQGVLDSTKNLAQQVADAMKQGTAGAGSQFGAQIKDQLKAITVEQDQLRAQSDGTTDKGQKKAIKGQMDQLNIAKDQLKAQSSQLGYSEKYGDSQANSTKQQEAQLDLQEQQLKAQYDATTDKGQREKLKVQMDQIKAQKDQLKLQGAGKDGADKTDQITQGLGQSVNKMVDIGKNFAMANVSQFENDIGISGKGAIPTIANIGLDWATSTLGNLASGLIGGAMGGGQAGVQHHIHVQDVPSALAASQKLENRQALTYNPGK